MTNNMSSISLRENVILTKIILTTDGTNGCVKGDTWCQMGAFGIPYCRTILNSDDGVVQAVWPLPLVWQMGMWAH